MCSGSIPPRGSDGWEIGEGGGVLSIVQSVCQPGQNTRTKRNAGRLSSRRRVLTARSLVVSRTKKAPRTEPSSNKRSLFSESEILTHQTESACSSPGRGPNRTHFEMDGLGNSTDHEKSDDLVGPLVQNVTIIRSPTIQSTRQMRDGFSRSIRQFGQHPPSEP